MESFGFGEPQLTKAQEEELEQRLVPLYEQCDKLFGDEECYKDECREDDV